MKSSTKSGQSQLLIPLLLIISSAMVFATNVTLNLTKNTTPSGAFVGIPNSTNETNNSQEFVFPIEVWAETYIGMNIDGNVVKAHLFLDNQTKIENHQINLYLNGVFFGSDLTDVEGIAEFTVSEFGEYKIFAVFEGRDFLNPSEINLTEIIQENEVIFEILGTEQGDIEIGEPVKWEKKFRLFNPNDRDALADFELDFPEDAFSVNVAEKDTKKMLNLIKKSIREWLKANESREYMLEYFTDSPVVIEELVNKYKKVINISSPIHYENVPVYTDIEETSQDSIRIYWIVDGERVDITNNPSFNVIFIDSNGNGLIDRVEWVVPHLSDQIFEISITVLNVDTLVRDGDNWVVAFNTTGTANLTINSTNAGWTEFLTDNTSTFDEMLLLDINCGNVSLKDSLQLIDEFDNVYNYSDLTANDTIDIKHLFVENYSCNDTGLISNNMLKAGYAALQFTFGDQIAYAYDAAVVCNWSTDTVNWADQQGGGGSAWGTSNTTWNLGYNCSEAGGPSTGCYIANITINMYGASASPASGGLGFVIFSNDSTQFFPLAINVGGAYTYGPVDSCGANNNYTGGTGYPGSTPNSTPNTCNISFTDWFNVTSYTVNWYIPGKGSVSIPTISYQWCWEDALPKLDNPAVNGTQSGYSAGWGSIFNFSVEIWEPQGSESNVSLWYTPTAGTGWMFAGSRNDTSPPTSSPGNLTNFTINYSCSGGTITDSLSNDLGVVGAAKYYKFNATDPYSNKNDTFDSYGNIYFTPTKDDVNVVNETPTANIIINRSDTTDFVVEVYDREKQSYGSGQSGKIWVSTYEYDQNTSYLVSTNSTGHLVQTFTNAIWCGDEKYYLGVHKWSGGTDSDSCVQNNVTESSNFTLLGSLYNTLNIPDGSSNFTQAQTIDFTASVADDCSVGRTATSTINITMVNNDTEYFCIASAAGECSISTDISFPTGWYNVTIVSNKSYHNDGYSIDQDVFYLLPYRNVFNESVNPDSAYWSYPNWNFSVLATSGDNDQMNVSLYLRKQGESYSECTGCFNQTPTICVNCENQSVFWYRNFTEPDSGSNWYYQFRMYNNLTGELEDQTTEHSFYVDSIPDEKIYLENVTQSPSSGQWGGTPFTFNITVNTTGINNVSVFLWTSDSATGPWSLVEYQNYTIPPGGWQIINYTTYFDCNDIDTDKYFFFNATNYNMSTNTTTPQSFEITRDRIELDYYWGHDSTANRSGDQTDFLLFRATNVNGSDMGSFPIKYSVTSGNSTETYYTDNNFVTNTNSTGFAEFYFNATCLNDYIGAPKFQVREQQWKAQLNDSELDCYYQNDSSDIWYRNMSVMGNILITLSNPDGTENVTQENIMTFLGSSDDDCGDSLKLNYTFGYEEIKYYANNTPTTGFDCGNSTLIGANAYRCYWQTDTDTPVQDYNASMFVNRIGYYPNQTLDDASRGWLFYVDALRQFTNISVVPSSALWDTTDWNFSVIATSGDYNNETIVLQLKQGAGAWQNCEDALAQCYNMTPTNCTHCINETYFWHANFTADDAGTWFYKFQMNNSDTYVIDEETTGTDSFDVLASDVKIYMENVTKYPTTGSWGGGNFTFNVTVNTSGINNVSVFLWTSNSSTGPWTLIEEQNYTIPPGDWQQFNFSNAYYCDDIGTNYFFFNATNYNLSTNMTSPQSFTVTKDTVILEYIEGNNTIANRSGSQTQNLSIRLSDGNGTYLTDFNMTYYVETNSFEYDSGNNVTSDSSGYANYSFEPTCSGPRYEVGNQNWKTAALEQQCYQTNDTDTAGFALNLTVMGDFNISFNYPETVNQSLGDQVIFESVIKDNCNVELGGIEVRYNATNENFNDECSLVTSPATGLYRCFEGGTNGWDSTGARQGWYNATINATKDFYWNNVTTKAEEGLGHFYLYRKPTLSGDIVVPSIGGWALDRNFSVNVTDDPIDNVTVFLWHRSSGGTGNVWEQISTSKLCSDCDNTNVNWTDVSYNCSFASAGGSVDYKFNATDLDLNNTEASGSFTVNYDNVSVTNITPVATATINRTDTTSFIIGLYDLDNSTSPNNTQSKIWFTTTDAATWESDVAAPTIYSNSTGHLNRSMTASGWTNLLGCDNTYSLGVHYWKGGSYGSNCPPGLVDNITSSIIFTLMGELSNTIYWPVGTQNYTVGSGIHLNGTVVRDSSCGAATGISVLYNITNGTHAYSCDGVHRGNGVYNCSWDSSDKATGWYNITMISYGSNYHNGTDVQSDAFYLRSGIQLEDISMEPVGGGSYGYSPFNFTVNVTSSDNENVTVYLYLQNVSGWFLENQSSCVSCDNTYFKFSKDYDCSNIGSWDYKFNATSVTGAVNNSLSSNSFTVTTDTISINYGSGNESYVNRSNTNPEYEIPLVVQVWDTVKNELTTDITLSNINAYVTTSGSSWMELSGGLGTVVNNTTHFNVTFDPNCSFSAGKRNWKFNISGETCYGDAESSNYNVTVVGNLSAYYMSPTGGAIYDLGDNVPLLGNLTDECSNDIINSNVGFQLNSSPSTSYFCTSPGNVTGNFYSCDWDSNSYDVGYYNVTMISWNDSYVNGTDFETDAIEIKSIPDLDVADVNPRAEGWVKTFNFTVNVSDNAGDTVNVYLWESTDGSEPWIQIGGINNCTTCVNETMTWNKTYICDDVGNNRVFKFNSTDTEGNNYSTSLVAGDYVGGSNTFNIEKNNIGIEYIIGNETNASTVDPALFIVRVYDIDNSSSYYMTPSIDISFNVTKQGLSNTFFTVGSNTSNATGHIIYYFTPDSSFASVKQNWTAFTSAGEGCYKLNQSDYYNVTTQTHVPKIENETVDPQVGGWGDARQFNVSIYDANDTAVVRLWKSTSTGGPWTFVAYQNYTDVGNWENVSFLINFTCTDYRTEPWYFKLNVSDDFNNTNSTDTPEPENNYTVNKDAVIFEEFYGNNSTANRIGSQTDLLSLRLRDGNGTYLTDFNATFYVTTDGVSWPGSGVVNQSNSSGYVHYNFNPICSPKNQVGDQMWKVEVGDSCYQTNSTNTSDLFLNLTVMGNINLTFTRPDGTTNYTQEDPILFQGYTYDDCGGAIAPTVKFYANNSTDYGFDCGSVQKIGENVFECTWQTQITTPRGWYNTTMDANITGHYNNFSINSGTSGLFYLNPIYKIENILGTPTTDGWGYTNWNFSAIISSGDPDTSYPLEIFMNKGSPDFTTACSGSTCFNQTTVECIYPECVNKTVFWYRNFSYNDQGTWFFKLSLAAEETSGNDIVTVVKDDILINHSFGNGESVNRSGDQSKLLVVFVNDTDRNLSAANPFVNVYFNVTNNTASNYLIYGANSTNTTGYSNATFNPNCDYSNGTQNWFSYVSGDSNYNDANSSIFNITIYGDLNPSEIRTYNTTHETNYFFHGQNVNITGIVEDDCGNRISNETGINVTFEVFKNNTYPASADTYCFDVTYLGNGIYSCLWDTKTYENDTYKIRMDASNVSFHNNGTYSKPGAFGLNVPPNTPPVVSDGSVTPDPGGWGSTFNFSVNVTDGDEFQNVTVHFWESPDGSEPWTLIEDQTCTDCVNTTVKTVYFSKNDYSCQQIGIRYYKFNATDNSSEANAGSDSDDGPYSFNLTRDNVEFINPVGSAGTVNRSGSQDIFLAVRINDTTKGVLVESNVTAGRFWITYDELNWNSGSSNRTSNSSSYVNYTFDPTCTPTRYNVSNAQQWKVGVLNDSCYIDANSSNYTLTIKGDLTNSMISPDGDDVFYDLNNITFEGNITSDCGDNSINDANVTFSISHQASTYYGSPDPANNNGTFYNATHNVTGTPGGNYSFTMNSSRNLYNPDTDTLSNAFHHQIDPQLTSDYVSPVTGSWGTTFSFYTAVTDDDDDVNLTLWVRCTGGNTTFNPLFDCNESSDFKAWGSPSSQICADCVSQQMNSNWTTSIAGHIGDYEWFFNSSDNYGGSNNTTIKTFNVTRRNVYFNVSQGNSSNVSRIGSNNTLLQVRLFDAFNDAGLSGFSVKFYVTLDGAIWDSSVSNTTYSGGYGDYYFNPTCPSPFFKTGRQWWKTTFDQTNAYNTGNSVNYTVDINSTLNGTVIYPTGQIVFSQGDTVEIIANLEDECEYIDNADSVVFRAYPGSWSCAPEPAENLNNGTYNCTLATGSLGTDIYNLTINSSKSYYYDGYDVEQNAFEIRKAPVLANHSITPTAEGWGYNYTINLTVQDQDLGDVDNVTLWKSVGGGDWEFVQSQNCSSCTAETTKTFYPQFNCTDYTNGPNINLKFNSSDSYGLADETSNFSVTFQKDNVSFTIVEGGGTVNRETDTKWFIVIVNDSDRNNDTIDNSQEVVDGKYWFSYSSVPIFDEGHDVQTNASGHMSHEFAPNCTYQVGTEYWYVETTGNDCYADTATSQTGNTYVLKGQLKTNLFEPVQYSEFNVTQNITFRWNVYSDCSNEGNITGVTNTIDLNNFDNTSTCSSPQEEGASGVYNCTWNSTGEPEGNWTVNVTSEKNPSLEYNTNYSSYQDWFFLNNKNATGVNPLVNPPNGGWGVSYRYNITVNDSENDTVSCSLYTNTSGSWVYRGINDIVTPGNCSIVVDNFTCSDQGTGQYYFMINDTYNTINTSETLGTTSGPSIGRDEVSVTLVQSGGYPDYNVNRSGGQNTTLMLLVNDTIRNQVTNDTNVTFWVTTDRVSYDSGNVVNTNETGHAIYVFNPNCSAPFYDVGNQTWIGGTNDYCYNDTNTTANFSLMLWGDLINTVIEPTSGFTVLRGNNTTIRVNVTDDCSAAVNIDTINLTSIQEPNEYGCSPILNETGTGFYNCTFNTSSPSLMPARYYKINVNTTKQNHTFGDMNETDAFFIETEPVLTNESVTPEQAGWGSTYTFTVNFTDEDLDTSTVTVWFRKCTDENCTAYSPDWSGANSISNSTVTGIGTSVSFNKNWVCGDIGYWQYKFNSSDSRSYVNETAVHQFNLTRDAISIEHYYGDNSTSNRSIPESQMLTVRVLDIDRGYYIHGGGLPSTVNGKILITNDTVSNFLTVFSDVASSGGGYLNRTWTPNCTFEIGPQKWKATMENDGCYQDNISSEFSLNLTTYPLQVNVIQPINNQIYLRSIENILVKGNVTDDCSASLGIGVVNASVIFTAEKQDIAFASSSPLLCTVYNESDGEYNCTILNTTHNQSEWDYGIYNITMNATKNYYNNSATTTEQNSFTLGSEPELTSVTVSSDQGGSTGGWGETWLYSANIRDKDSNTVNVSLWAYNLSGTSVWELLNSTSCPGALCANPTTSFQTVTFDGHTFACSNLESLLSRGVTFKFNASDTLNYTNESSNSTFTLERDNTLTQFVPGDSGGSVNREGDNTVSLVVQIQDEDKGYINVGGSVSSKIFVTYNGTEWDSGGDETTNSSGFVNYDFNATCAYETGIKTWRGGPYNDLCYKPSNSTDRNVSVWGQLKNNLDLPAYGSNYFTGEPVSIRFNTTSDCSGEGLIANATPGAIELSLAGSTWLNCTGYTNEYDGWYNCTWTDSVQTPGEWDIRFNSSKSSDYYNSNSTVYADWFNLSNSGPTYNNQTVSPSSNGWGASFNYSVNVTDLDSDAVNCTLFTYTNGAWSNRGFVNVSPSYPKTCSIIVNDFTCNDIGTDNWFKWQLADEINVANTTNSSGPNITANSIQLIHVYGNNQEVNRTYGNLDLDVFVNDTTKNQGVGSGGSPTASVYFNITTDGTNYITEGSDTTSSGNASINFAPTCSDYSVGEQNWFTYVAGDSCYIDQNSSTFNLTINGSVSLIINSPDGEKYLRGENNTLLRGNVTDDCGLSFNSSIVNFTAIHRDSSTEYMCSSNNNEGDGNYNCTVLNTTHDSWSAKGYDVKFNATADYYNYNETTQTCLPGT
ncbi:MAG: hypothetical protein ABIE55_00555, partial [Candidatus Aenigmatarchaeota archaeon]